MREDNGTNPNKVESIHILNISDLKKTGEKDYEPEESIDDLKKWLFWSLVPSTVFLLISVFLRRFLLIVPLPPIIAWGTYKIRKISRRLDRDHPLLK